MSPISDFELSVVIDGPGTAEIWCGSSLLGIVFEQNGGTVIRLESHARALRPVSAIALERALTEAREGVSA